MSSARIRKQETEGKPAAYIKSGKEVLLHAIDFSSRELPIYVENQQRNPQTGELPAEEPKFFCPSCGNHKLTDKGISGPNSERRYTCPGCSLSWVRRENMQPGVGLEMQ
jgi:predicted RNA-binding Zn-ribbon protein involved in translation (DUF1610 family)